MYAIRSYYGEITPFHTRAHGENAATEIGITKIAPGHIDIDELG